MKKSLNKIKWVMSPTKDMCHGYVGKGKCSICAFCIKKSDNLWYVESTTHCIWLKESDAKLAGPLMTLSKAKQRAEFWLVRSVLLAMFCVTDGEKLDGDFLKPDIILKKLFGYHNLTKEKIKGEK